MGRAPKNMAVPAHVLKKPTPSSARTGIHHNPHKRAEPNASHRGSLAVGITSEPLSQSVRNAVLGIFAQVKMRCIFMLQGLAAPLASGQFTADIFASKKRSALWHRSKVCTKKDAQSGFFVDGHRLLSLYRMLE